MKKICCFAGHSKIYNYNEIYNRLSEVTEKIIIEKNINEFLVGNYGAFDKLANMVLSELKEKYKIKINLVIPYLTKEININKDFYSEKFDNIIIADIPLSTPRNLKIIKCNEYMIKNCDYLICHIEHSWGGAYKTVSFAKKQKKIKIIDV